MDGDSSPASPFRELIGHGSNDFSVLVVILSTFLLLLCKYLRAGVWL